MDCVFAKGTNYVYLARPLPTHSDLTPQQCADSDILFPIFIQYSTDTWTYMRLGGCFYYPIFIYFFNILKWPIVKVNDPNCTHKLLLNWWFSPFYYCDCCCCCALPISCCCWLLLLFRYICVSVSIQGMFMFCFYQVFLTTPPNCARHSPWRHFDEWIGIYHTFFSIPDELSFTVLFRGYPAAIRRIVLLVKRRFSTAFFCVSAIERHLMASRPIGLGVIAAGVSRRHNSS